MKKINLLAKGVATGMAVLVLPMGVLQAKTLKPRLVQKPVKVRVSPKRTTTTTTNTTTTTTTTSQSTSRIIPAPAQKEIAPLGAKSVKSSDSLRQASAAPIPAPAAAAGGTTQAEIAPVAAPTKTKSRFGLTTILAVSRDLRVTDHPDHSSGMYVELDPTFKLSEKFTLVGVFSGTKSFTGDMASKVDDGMLGVSMSPIPLESTKVFSLSPRLYGIIPLSDRSREVTTTQGGVVGALRLFIKPSDSPFSMYYQPSFTRYFNEYMENPKGGVNKASKLKHRANIDLDLGKKWALNFVFDFSSVWDYNMEIANDFNADQSINYQLTDALGLALGHTTSGDFWNEDRSESKYTLTDPEMSEVYFGLTLAL